MISVYVNEPSMTSSERFGSLSDGRAVSVSTLKGTSGAEARVITYGGAIVSLRVPDREGRLDDVVLGYDDLDGYVRDRCFMGGVIGRYANRIRGGRFVLDGRQVALETNDGRNHLHGGSAGFHRQLWTAEPTDAGVRLSLTSPDGDGGYPGRLDVGVTYTLTPENELVVDYAASTDRPTPVSLTQHSYFNLAGSRSGVLGHLLAIEADAYTPVDATLIPTGERAPVAGTPFDFTRETPVGARIGDAHEQLRHGHGYDHNFALRSGGGTLARAARLADPLSGRVLVVRTTEPGLHFYSGNFLGGEPAGRGGRAYAPHDGLCLETQAFPDSPNRPEFPGAIVRPGAPYRSRTVFAFSTDRS
jgi:aldose 1-epimerase